MEMNAKKQTTFILCQHIIWKKSAAQRFGTLVDIERVKSPIATQRNEIAGNWRENERKCEMKN